MLGAGSKYNGILHGNNNEDMEIDIAMMIVLTDNSTTSLIVLYSILWKLIKITIDINKRIFSVENVANLAQIACCVYI